MRMLRNIWGSMLVDLVKQVLIDLRSQLMLESYVSALDQAIGELASKPLGRYEDLNFGGWVFGIDTKEGVVFHAFYEG